LTYESNDQKTYNYPAPAELSVDADGNPVTETVIQKAIQTVLEEVEETRVALVPDLSLLAGQDIFQYAYGKLKEKLVAEFGASYVKDC
jgi:hypothetical protein